MTSVSLQKTDNYHPNMDDILIRYKDHPNMDDFRLFSSIWILTIHERSGQQLALSCIYPIHNKQLNCGSRVTSLVSEAFMFNEKA